MAHDELMAKIMKDSLVMRHELEKDENGVFDRLMKISNALLAVVELHKPWDGARMGGGGFNGPWCTHCEEVFDGSIRYPCPTIQAIEKKMI